MNRKKMIILIAAILLVTSLLIVPVEGRRRKRWMRHRRRRRWKPKPTPTPKPKPKIAYINPDHIWYNYDEGAIYINVKNVGTLLIDIQGHEQGPDSCGVVHMNDGWHYLYGNFADIGVARFGGGYWYTWALRIGELYIDPGTEWHIQAPDGEWYSFSLTDYTAPTNWIVKVRASDGTNSLPITEPFYFSYDNINWQSFAP